MDARAVQSAQRSKQAKPGQSLWAPSICSGLIILEVVALISGRLLLPHIIRGQGLGDGLAGRLVSWDGFCLLCYGRRTSFHNV